MLFLKVFIVAASAVNIKGMMRGFEIIQFTGCTNDLFNARITEFHNLSCIKVNQVIMLHTAISLFELCYVLAELMLYHKVAVKQKFNGIIQRGTAHPVVLVLHKNVQGFDIKVSVPGVDLIKDGIPFRRFPVTLFLKIIGKDLFYGFFGFFTYHKLD
jgi:hypothetical protein